MAQGYSAWFPTELTETEATSSVDRLLPLEDQSYYIGATSFVSMFLCFTVGFIYFKCFRQAWMKGPIGRLLLAWNVCSAVFNAAGVVNYMHPQTTQESNACYHYNLISLWSLYASPLYFLSLNVVLFNDSKNPFKSDTDLKYHILSIFVGFLWAEANMSTVAPESETVSGLCSAIFIHQWDTYLVGRALFGVGGVVLLKTIWQVQVAVTGKQTVFTDKKKVVLKSLMTILVFMALYELSMPSLIIWLKNWVHRGTEAIILECLMLGLSTSVSALGWLLVMGCFRQLLMEQGGDNDEISKGLREQVVHLINQGIMDTARAYQDKPKSLQACADDGQKLYKDVRTFTSEDGVEIQARAPEVFYAIRRLRNVNGATFAKALEGEVSGDFSEGKSGAFMYFTQDKHYIVKTATGEEFALLFDMLPGYHKHVEANPDTMINPILGAFELKLHSQHVRVIVVESVFFQLPFDIHLRYDLKGSWHGRTTKVKGSGMAWDRKDSSKPVSIRECLKDKDVPSPFLLDKGRALKIGEQLRRDSDFLAQHGVMDYSLLVGVGMQVCPLGSPNAKELDPLEKFHCPKSVKMEGPHSYCMGIIDVLQRFTFRKQFEYFALVKVLRKGPGVSCVPPEQYGKRFKENIVGGLIEPHESNALRIRVSSFSSKEGLVQPLLA